MIYNPLCETNYNKMKSNFWITYLIASLLGSAGRKLLIWIKDGIKIKIQKKYHYPRSLFSFSKSCSTSSGIIFLEVASLCFFWIGNAVHIHFALL
jgi:hypothetical protein